MRRREVEGVFDLFLEPGDSPPEDLVNYPGYEGQVLNLIYFNVTKLKAIYRRSTV